MNAAGAARREPARRAGRRCGAAANSIAAQGDTRSRIVAAAVALFAEQGYDATSVNEVVARAGVAKGALYHHFQSKDDLLYEVYRELVERQLAGLADILERRLAPADTLRAIVLDMVETTTARTAEATVFFREGHRLTDTNQQRVRAARRQIHDAVTELIRSGQRDGRFAAVASPEMVTFTIFGVINELPVWYSPDGPKTPRAACRRTRRPGARRADQPAARASPSASVESDSQAEIASLAARRGDRMSLGLTVPQTGLGLAEHAELLRALPDLGYTDVWSAEASGADAFTPLALAAAWQPALNLGTAIVPVFTRGPALIAQSAASLAAAAPGRFSLGLGASSPTIVERWNGIGYDRPYLRTRDVLRFVRAALAGELVDGEFDTFTIGRFRLEQPPAEPVPVLLAGLRPQMLALAGREADGAILNWLAAKDVPKCLAAVGNPASRSWRGFSSARPRTPITPARWPSG